MNFYFEKSFLPENFIFQGLFGLQGSSGGSGFVATIRFVITRFHELRPADALLGVGSIAILLAMRVSFSFFPSRHFHHQSSSLLFIFRNSKT